MGQTYPYYRNILGGLALDSSCTNIWDCADVCCYDNQMVAYNYTDANKKSIYAHEVGHVLSLAHNDSTTFLLMNTSSFNTINAVSPKEDDKANLKLNWGN